MEITRMIIKYVGNNISDRFGLQDNFDVSRTYKMLKELGSGMNKSQTMKV
jgi:hypothetical protein